jgi:hypothetical protein
MKSADNMFDKHRSRVDDPSEKPRIIFGCIKDLHPTLQRTRPAIFATNASAALD